MKYQKDLLESLQELQKNTIGLARIYGKIEMVVDADADNFTTISIGSLGGMVTNHYPKTKFDYKRFPQNMSLFELVGNFELYDNWFKETKFFLKD